MNELQYQAALDKTLELFENFNFNDSTKSELTNINGHELPMDYLYFIRHYNGGEGEVGQNSYMPYQKYDYTNSGHILDNIAVSAAELSEDIIQEFILKIESLISQ